MKKTLNNRFLPDFSLFFLAASVAIVLSFSSCSQAAPRIQATNLRLVYHEAPEGVYERFSFFVIAEDDDGPLDLEELYLIKDDQQLLWTLKSSDWLKVQKNGQNWIGSHSIAMADDKVFPRGLYRALIVDKGGERSERSLAFDAPSTPLRAFPTLKLDDGRYIVSSSYPKNMLLVYDTSGALIKNIPLVRLEGQLADLNLGNGARALALWAEDESSYVAAITESNPLK